MTRWSLYEAPPEGATCQGCGYGATIYGIQVEGKRGFRLADEHFCNRLALARHRNHVDGEPFSKAPECVLAEERGREAAEVYQRCTGREL